MSLLEASRLDHCTLAVADHHDDALAYRAVTASGSAAPPASPELETLQQWFAHDSVLGNLGQAAAAVDAELWELALLGPARQFLSRPGKALRQQFMQACFVAAGGQGELPFALAYAVELLHAGSLIVDDIEDNSQFRRGKPALHIEHGLPIALNCGNWMYFWAFALVRGTPIGNTVAAQELLTNVLVRCHHGQALDVACSLSHVPHASVGKTVHAIAALKAGALMRLAAGLAALAAGAAPATVTALCEFAEAFGIALQRFDDIGSLAGDKDPAKKHEDLKNRRLTWPWAVLAQSLNKAHYDDWVHKAVTLPPEQVAHELRMATGSDGMRIALADLQTACDHVAQAIDASQLAGLSTLTAALRNHYVI